MRPVELKRNGLFLVFLLYSLIIIGIEWINFVFYFVGVTVPTGIVETIVFFIAIFLYYRVRKSKTIIPVFDFNAEKLIGIAFIMIFGLVMAVYPDVSYDTGNYHLIAQNPHFENYFQDDFGYGNFQVWGFRLPDRLFYYFRLLFGYRLGTLLNPVVLAISFTQIYDILDALYKKVITDSNRFLRNVLCNRLLWAILVLFPLDVFLMLGIYYVDVIALPIALEVIDQLLIKNEERKSDCIPYFALLNGIWIGMKLTNVVYVVPCVALFIVIHYKEIGLKDWVLSIVLGLLPYADYLIFNYVCTRNPIFPYFNVLFKSDYFSLNNFKDLRWGGKDFYEKILWIIIAAIRPEYRQNEIYDLAPGLLWVGLALSAIFVICYVIRKKKQKDTICFCSLFFIYVITIVSSLLWSFTTGYSRYFIFGRILWGILSYGCLLFFCFYYKRIGYLLAVLSVIVLIRCFYVNMNSYVTGRNYSWTRLERESFREQLRNCFSDHDITKDYGVNADVFLLTQQTMMGIAELIDDDCYVMNVNYRYSDYSEQQNKKNRNYRENTAKNIYDIHERVFTDVAEYIGRLNEESLYMESIDSIMAGAGIYELIRVVPMCEKQKNYVWVSDSDRLEVGEATSEGIYRLSFITGRFYDWKDSPRLILEVYTNEKEIDKIEIDNKDIIIVSDELELNRNEKVYIEIHEKEGGRIPDDEKNKAFLINPSMEYL